MPLGNEGMITGTVSFTGEALAPRRIDMGQDPRCGEVNKDPRTEDVVVTNGRLANVFVYIKSGGVLDRCGFEIPSSEVIIYHLGCQLVPHVLGIQTGQTLMVVNSDLTTHNTHPSPRINAEWNVSQDSAGVPIVKRFNQPEVLIPIKDNQHPWEKGKHI